MKLYTEEQVRKAIEFAQKCEHDCGGVYFEYGIEDVLEDLTPIELPSDEEICNEGKLVFDEKGKTIYTHYNTVPSWTEGAKWMRDKIQGGNNVDKNN